MLPEFLIKFHNSFNIGHTFKIVFAMAGDIKNDNLRVQKVIQRFKDISKEIFRDKDIWIALILWNIERATVKELEVCGFNFENADFKFEGSKYDSVFVGDNFENFQDSQILYLYYNRFDFLKLKGLVKAIAGFELGVEPSANITCYFLNFETGNEVLLNLYDDRGMEFLTTNEGLQEKVLKKFKNYILSKNS